MRKETGSVRLAPSIRGRMTKKPDNIKHGPKKVPERPPFEGTVTKAWRESKIFTKFPRLIAADKWLSPGAVKLATILNCFDLPKPDERPDRRVGRRVRQGIVFPGNRRLADAMGVSEVTVIKYKKELREAGYLKEKRRFSRTSLHILTFPKISSIENLVHKYRLFGVPITAEDFRGIVDDGFMEKLVHFFRVVKEVKEAYREDMEEGQIAKLSTDKMEETALQWYREDGGEADNQT